MIQSYKSHITTHSIILHYFFLPKKKNKVLRLLMQHIYYVSCQICTRPMTTAAITSYEYNIKDR